MHPARKTPKAEMIVVATAVYSHDNAQPQTPTNAEKLGTKYIANHLIKSYCESLSFISSVLHFVKAFWEYPIVEFVALANPSAVISAL